MNKISAWALKSLTPALLERLELEQSQQPPYSEQTQLPQLQQQAPPGKYGKIMKKTSLWVNITFLWFWEVWDIPGGSGIVF